MRVLDISFSIHCPRGLFLCKFHISSLGTRKGNTWKGGKIKVKLIAFAWSRRQEAESQKENAAKELEWRRARRNEAQLSCCSIEWKNFSSIGFHSVGASGVGSGIFKAVRRSSLENCWNFFSIWNRELKEWNESMNSSQFHLAKWRFNEEGRRGQ